MPLRVKVSNSASAEPGNGLPLAGDDVTDEGQYRIAKLDQVTK